MNKIRILGEHKQNTKQELTYRIKRSMQAQSENKYLVFVSDVEYIPFSVANGLPVVAVGILSYEGASDGEATSLPSGFGRMRILLDLKQLGIARQE